MDALPRRANRRLGSSDCHCSVSQEQTLRNKISNQIACETNFDILKVFCLAKVSCKGVSLELKAPAEKEDGVLQILG